MSEKTKTSRIQNAINKNIIWLHLLTYKIDKPGISIEEGKKNLFNEIGQSLKSNNDEGVPLNIFIKRKHHLWHTNWM